MTEKQIEDAIQRSGYPVQGVVADTLGSTIATNGEKFLIQEEWSFIDRDTKDLRNLDLRADLTLHRWSPQPRVRPQLTLLIECKQSELPFIFFEEGRGPRLKAPAPRVAGLRSEDITITSDDDPSSWTLGIGKVLNLHQHPFQQHRPISHNLSKCIRKGADLELSGADPYNSIVLRWLRRLTTLSRPARQPKQPIISMHI